MTPRAELKTARLTLRPVMPEDEAIIVDCLNDLEVSGWLAVVPYPYAPEDFRQFQTEYAVPGQTYAVTDAQGLAGILGVEDRTLGYWLAPRAQGLGYATEAARTALAAHFEEDAGAIASGYYEVNRRSANVLRKLGFVETGRGPKHCRALDCMRPHVDLILTREAFVAALPVEARSERMTFRSLQPSDLMDLHAIVSDLAVVRQLASYPWPPDLSFTRTRAMPYGGDGFVWGAFLDGRLIGTVAVTGTELGYMFAPDVWGRGLASEACRLAVDHAFALGRDHLVAGIWADNDASQNVLTKLGFCITGKDMTENRARGQMVAGKTFRLDRAGWRPNP